MITWRSIIFTGITYCCQGTAASVCTTSSSNGFLVLMTSPQILMSSLSALIVYANLWQKTWWWLLLTAMAIAYSCLGSPTACGSQNSEFQTSQSLLQSVDAWHTFCPQWCCLVLCWSHWRRTLPVSNMFLLLHKVWVPWLTLFPVCHTVWTRTGGLMTRQALSMWTSVNCLSLWKNLHCVAMVKIEDNQMFKFYLFFFQRTTLLFQIEIIYVGSSGNFPEGKPAPTESLCSL